MSKSQANPLLYVPGGDRAADKLAELYEGLGSSAFAAVAETEERDPKDPFGQNQKREVTDDYRAALEPTQRLVKFFSLLCGEFGLGPRAGIFMIELTALNVMNADDVPLTAEELAKARQDAFEYYSKVRKELTEAAARKPR